LEKEIKRRQKDAEVSEVVWLSSPQRWRRYHDNSEVDAMQKPPKDKGLLAIKTVILKHHKDPAKRKWYYR
jgi:hypothetical protein